MSKNTRLTVKGVIILSAVSLISSGAALTGDTLSDHLPPVTLSTFRFTLGTVFLYFIVALKKETIYFNLRDLPLFVFLALTGIVLYNLVMFYGLQFTNAVNCSLITSSSAAVIYLFALVFLKETFHIRHLSGILLAFGGVTVAMLGTTETHGLPVKINPGDVLIIVSTLLWALYSIGGSFAMKKYSPLATTTITCTIGTFILLFITVGKRALLPFPDLSSSLWLQLIFLGVISTGLAFFWWYEGIKEIGASYSAMFLNVVPVSTLIFSQVIMHQPFTFFQLSGVFLVVVGLFLIM